MERADADGAHAPGSRLGEYTLLGRIGRGGQGEVYEARQESLGRSVALKILSGQFTSSEERLQRFRREAAAGGRLAHPNIVAVHAVGEAGEVRYIAQELVEGGRTLADMFDEARRLPELPRDWYEHVAQLFEQVADALHSAHEAGIIHRDVKPGNILLTRDGRPKVADFGLALMDDDLLRSRSGELVGTPFYMSPEQVTGGRLGIDRRTDVFSLGTTLYEALTLQRPFDGDSRERIVQSILLHDPPDPSKLRRHIPRDLAVICLRALEKRPERRYADAAEFAADLRRHLAGEPILARPPSGVVRAGKWMRRHPLVVAQGVVVLGLLSWLAGMAHAWREAEAGRVALQRGQAATMQFEQTQEEVIRLIGDLSHAGGSADAEQPLSGMADRLAELAPTLPRSSDVSWYVHVIAGRQYLRLREYAKAGAMLETALEMAREMPDDTQSDRRVNLAISSFELGRLRRETHDYAAAEALFLEAIERFGRVLDPHAPQINDVEGQLARLYSDSGRRTEAEVWYRRFLAGARMRSGMDAPIAEAQYALGEFLLMQGRLEEAAEQLLPAWEAGAADAPNELRWGLGSVVGWLTFEQGRRAAAGGQVQQAAVLYAKADELLARVLAGQRDLYGGPDEQVARTLVIRGSLLRTLGRLDEARATLEEAIAIAQTTIGARDALTLVAWNDLAVLRYKSGDVPGAEAAWRAIVDADRQAPLDVPEPALNALENLSVLCFNDERIEEAIAYADEAVARTPPDHPERGKRVALLDRCRAAVEPLADTR